MNGLLEDNDFMYEFTPTEFSEEFSSVFSTRNFAKYFHATQLK